MKNTARPKAMSPLTGKALPPRRSPAKTAAAKALTEKPGRRTQAERLAETRAKIITATVTYIDERGFHQTSLQRVAQEAGVTVGAVQHHFTSKTELLTAVVEDNFQQLTHTLQGVAFTGSTLKERISLFVDSCWSFCNSSRYQASLQILLGMRSEGEQDKGTDKNFEQWINQTLGHVVSEGFQLWQQVFHDVGFDDSEHFDILLYIFSSLSGSALLSRISQHPARVEGDLRELKKLLLLRFTGMRDA